MTNNEKEKQTISPTDNQTKGKVKGKTHVLGKQLEIVHLSEVLRNRKKLKTKGNQTEGRERKWSIRKQGQTVYWGKFIEK